MLFRSVLAGAAGLARANTVAVAAIKAVAIFFMMFPSFEDAPHVLWSTSENAGSFRFVDAEKIYFFASTRGFSSALIARLRTGPNCPGSIFCPLSVKTRRSGHRAMSEHPRVVSIWP